MSLIFWFPQKSIHHFCSCLLHLWHSVLAHQLAASLYLAKFLNLHFWNLTFHPGEMLPNGNGLSLSSGVMHSYFFTIYGWEEKKNEFKGFSLPKPLFFTVVYVMMLHHTHFKLQHDSSLPDLISFVAFFRYTRPFGMGIRISLWTDSTKLVVPFFPWTTRDRSASLLSMVSTTEFNQDTVCGGTWPIFDLVGNVS